MSGPVFIMELQSAAFTTWNWLHKECALARRAETNRGMPRWLSVKQLLDAKGRPRRAPGNCADCSTRAQLSPGYVTPTLGGTL